MSANNDCDSNKASSESTGSSGLMDVVIAGTRLLRKGRMCSSLGIAGYMLPLVFAANRRVIRLVLAAADRAVNGKRPERKQDACNEDNPTCI
jgi:hypothetical protein